MYDYDIFIIRIWTNKFDKFNIMMDLEVWSKTTFLYIYDYRPKQNKENL